MAMEFFAILVGGVLYPDNVGGDHPQSVGV